MLSTLRFGSLLPPIASFRDSTYAKLVEKKTRAESSRSVAAVAWEAGAEDEIEDTMSISQ